VLEIDAELAFLLARLEAAGPVLDVRDRSRPRVLADDGVAARPRRESPVGVAAAHVGAPHVADARIESVADRQLLELQTISIAVVIELSAIARAVGSIRQARRAIVFRARPVGVDR